jgi:DNA gyrase subunit B
MSDTASSVRPVPGTPPVPITAPNGAGYSADQIKVLEGLEAVRQRPGMYIGGTGLNALHHLVYEVVDNSIDEAMAGFARTVSVTIHPDGSCSVVDDGRGIPVDPIKHEKPEHNGKPAIEVVLTVLHSGGKFGQEGSAYKVSGGLHGVGVSCVNALSDFLRAEVCRDGKVYAIEFERGRVTQPLAVVGPMPANSARKTGTTVTFRPDPTIFPDTGFNAGTLATRLRELAYLNPGVVIRFTDERVGPDGKVRSEVFHATTGLSEYVEHLTHGKNVLSPVVYFKKEDAPASLVCEVALRYHDGYNETVLSFANNINNVDGGTHAQGFKNALTRALNTYARKNGVIKEKDPTPSGEDLREGLIAIVSVKLPNPAFNNQPKERLLNPEIEGFVGAAVNAGLDAWLEEHPADAKRLCMKGIVAAQAREAARKARELTRRKSALESGSMPHKLKDCRTKGEESEIFIVEGDSAGGSAGQGRDVDLQAVLPLKGKIINVEKARLDKVLSFEEVRILIQALKCGIGEEFDAAKLRYGKIIIMTDADVDGSHIRTLLLTFFFRQMPELIRRGHVYIAQPPLYQVAAGSGKARKSSYVLNDRVLQERLEELGMERSELEVRRVADAEGRGPSVAPERTLRGDALRRAVFMLRRLSELVTIAERRGVKFPDLLAARAGDPTGKGRLPTHRVGWRGGDAWCWSEGEALALVSKRGLALADGPGNGVGAPAGAEGETPVSGPAATVRELHENRELERLFAELGGLGLAIDDYALVQEESVAGEKMAARYAWVVSGGPTHAVSAGAAGVSGGEDEADAETSARSRARVVECPNIPSILEGLNQIGRRGLEIKRFKGLGEMDAEQLWVTTMDPSKRTLLRVNWDVASEADALFTTLMGEEVEPRRKFIEDHALEVKNLDV